MNSIIYRAVCVATAAWLATMSLSASALERGALPHGGTFVVGGIGQDEIAQLDAERRGYALWVITAAKVSGAYLADVRLRVIDGGQRYVFDRVLSGPWVLIDLPPGKYEIRASYGGEERATKTTIHAGDHRQTVFYFNASDD